MTQINCLMFSVLYRSSTFLTCIISTEIHILQKYETKHTLCLASCCPYLGSHQEKSKGYQSKKKTRYPGSKTTPRHCIKKKIFSHRLRKSPNSCPTHTQQHCNTRESRLALDMCFDMDKRGDFLQQQTTGRAIRRSTTADTCVCLGNKSPVRDAGGP
jgi:hypothetical protein